MTRVEFIFNVSNKITKTVDLCEKALAKGRQLTIFSPDEKQSQAIQIELWQHTASSFLANVPLPHFAEKHSPIHLFTAGNILLQDDILINLPEEIPLFFGRFNYLVELVGTDEQEKIAARLRYKFYRDRGYVIKSTDMANA